MLRVGNNEEEINASYYMELTTCKHTVRKDLRSCIKWNKNEQLNHSVQPILISSEITEIPDTAVRHPMSYILHLS